MSLTNLADTVQRMKEEEQVRNAVASGDAEVLAEFTEEEREALVELARRFRTGESLPKHQQRSKNILSWL